MSTKIGRERSLEKALKEVSGDYDFICIDTPPSLGLLTINALTAADKVIVPVQCEYLSMRGLVQLQNTLKMIQENLNPDVEIEGILPTMLDSRTVHAKEAVEILEENFGDLVFKSRIRKAIKFAEAPVRGASVLKYDPRANAANYYRDLAEGGSDQWRRRKRASMREGPLADLFRSTDEPEDPPEAPQSRERGEATAPDARRAGPADPRRAAGAAAPAPAPSPSPRLGRPTRRASATRSPSPIRAADGRAPPARPVARAEGAPQPVFDERLGPTADRRSPATAATSPYGPSGGEPAHARIRVVGVGGAGVNAVNRMVEAQIPGVEFMAVNTDLQSLQLCIADVTVHIGGEQTRGLGAGADPELGFKAAFEEQDKIKRLLKGSDMVFVAAGAGGGTGTGAAPSWPGWPARSARLPSASSPSRSASRAPAAARRPPRASRPSPPRSTP